MKVKCIVCGIEEESDTARANHWLVTKKVLTGDLLVVCFDCVSLNTYKPAVKGSATSDVQEHAKQRSLYDN